MYDINVKNIKKGKNFWYIFLGVGILMLVIFTVIIVGNVTKKNSLDSSTMSTSVEVRETTNSDGDTLYSPTYNYKVGHKEYSCKSNSSSSIYPKTDNKIVYYDSKNPSNCLTEYSLKTNYILMAFLLLPAIFLIISIININKISKRLKVIAELNQKGKLVKNLVYHLEDTGMVVNNVPIQRPVVDYTLPSGSVIKLQGDPRHDKKSSDADGMVDLVIDESNPDNYFIDFEINRIGGNLPQDYSNQNQQQPPQTINQNISTGTEQNQMMQQPLQNENIYNQQPPQTPPEINNQNFPQ